MRPASLTFCTIMSTLMWALASSRKIRAATPGVSGTLSRVALAWFLSAAMPRMIIFSMLSTSSRTSVPGLTTKLETTSSTTP